ncbi:MAG: hypothetical protein HUK20_14275 [Fibrobacter sp.]|nr:hypothetical protein [Fibrobacter sp.]
MEEVFLRIGDNVIWRQEEVCRVITDIMTAIAGGMASDGRIKVLVFSVRIERLIYK